jgi:xanthosine utilization system XapX-like protein
MEFGRGPPSHRHRRAMALAAWSALGALTGIAAQGTGNCAGWPAVAGTGTALFLALGALALASFVWAVAHGVRMAGPGALWVGVGLLGVALVEAILQWGLSCDTTPGTSRNFRVWGAAALGLALVLFGLQRRLARAAQS